LLVALAAGSTLKAHRTVEGAKIYRLHSLHGAATEEIAPADVEALQRRGLVESNMKFPAAVFLLTERGAALVGSPLWPVGPRRFD
jgi:hypothetical protein